MQLFAPHVVVAVGYVHAVALLPSQTPPHVDAAPVHAGRAPCGVPLATVVHLPLEPATSHAWHWPPHA